MEFRCWKWWAYHLLVGSLIFFLIIGILSVTIHRESWFIGFKYGYEIGWFDKMSQNIPPTSCSTWWDIRYSEMEANRNFREEKERNELQKILKY